MTDLGFRAFDADNHYYEAEDALTRHADRKMARRAVQRVELRGRKRILVGGKLDRFIPNPSFDPVSKPGRRPAAVPSAGPEPCAQRLAASRASSA